MDEFMEILITLYIRETVEKILSEQKNSPQS